MRTAPFKILLAQINPMMGAIEDNARQMIDIIQTAEDEVIVFPELVLTGYPPEDLLLRHECFERVEAALLQMAAVTKSAYVLVGHPLLQAGHRYNAVSILHEGKVMDTYCKHHLPNYGVFDEKRYFLPGPVRPCMFEIGGVRCGVVICEDIWHPGPVEALIEKGAEVLLIINASPFEVHKFTVRQRLLMHYARQGVNVFYLNLVGGQDELVFDGGSCVIDKTGKLQVMMPFFETALASVTVNMQGELVPCQSQGASLKALKVPDENALIYQALCFATREYVTKNGFKKVVLGLSGGIDSALTLCIAVDALGADNVHAVLMPSRYTSKMSQEDAILQATTMGVKWTSLPIEPAVNTFNDILSDLFAGMPADLTEENLQARIRGLLLMAFSNKFGALLLSTSNKSESAVGYATLYGDMAGGFSPLKDVLKTTVYALAAFRNQNGEVIPERVITRAPSAELRADQKDEDSLPSYDVLDGIIHAYMIEGLSVDEMVEKRGYARDVAGKMVELIKRNEYKRHQSAPGVKISHVAFGPDWRYPLTSKF